jgi:four helix bundle protein
MTGALTFRMKIRKYRDLDTWQLTEAFKREVFRLVQESPMASRNFTYRDQIQDSAGAPSKHVAEGFLRNSPGEFCRYLDFAVSSVGETENHLQDGIELRYFAAASCGPARQLAYRCRRAILSLKRSQEAYKKRLEEHKEQERRRRRARRRGADSDPTR